MGQEDDHEALQGLLTNSESQPQQVGEHHTQSNGLVDVSKGEVQDLSRTGDALSLATPGEPLAQELRRVLRLALPVVASEVLSFASYLITTAQVGRLGAEPLSDFTLARTIFHITGLSLTVGLASGQDTFSGQAFGARQYKLVGIYLQRAVAINLVTASVVLTGWALGADQLMWLLRQDRGVVQGATPLLHRMGTALLPWAVQVPVHGYLAAQGVVLPMAILAGMGTITTGLINYAFITLMGLGLMGAAYAYNCLAVLETLGFLGCVVWLHYRQPAGAKTWQGLDLRAAFSGWPAYLRIALPSMAMICLDWWCFEVMILVAGLQPDAAKQQGAMGILFATHSLAFMVCSGFSTAAATRVANELGAGHGAAAARATRMCCAMSFLASLLVAAGLLLLRQPWARLYSQDGEVVAAVVNSMAFLCASVVFDSLNAALSGVIRGCGHQALGFVVNLCTLWLVGIPLAYKLDIVDGYGAVGVWMALAFASTLQALVLSITVWRFNWRKLAADAQQLVASGHDLATADSLAAAAGGPGGHHGVYEPLLGAVHV